MDNARGDNHRNRIRFTDQESLLPFRMSRAIFPQSKFVVAINEAKQIGLINMLVGTTGNAGVSDTDVSHGGQGAFRNLVGSKQLGEMPSRIVMAAK